MIARTLRLFAGFAACIALSTAFAAPTLLVSSDGILLGARGVVVDGASYDVRFVDGSCSTVFNGCSPSAFAFTTQSAATHAAQALLDFVFVDGPAGLFDSHPERTSGCSASLCYAMVPFANYQSIGAELGVFVREAVNTNYSDSVEGNSLLATDNLSDASVWAVFSTSMTADAVPEPGSIALLFAGAGAMVSIARRRATNMRGPIPPFAT